jgi:signal peptidase I
MVMTNLGWTPTQESSSDDTIVTQDLISTTELSPLDVVSPREEATKRRPSHKRATGFPLRTIGLWSKKALATVFVLAILGTAGVGAWALAQGSWAVNPVLSGSMRPGFTVGGVVISQRIPVSQLAVRDVIVFHNPNKPSEEMVHRIVQMTKGPNGQLLIKTQGDANPVRDPWTLTVRGNSVYKVRWALPLLGYVAVAYDNNRGLALMIAGLILLAVAVQTLLMQRRRSEARRTEATEATESLIE